jgi:E3 ubiquitin-protein ligase DOA10
MDETCAFCYGCDGQTIVACACTGGIERVHQACLDSWIKTGATSCSACRQPYRVPWAHMITMEAKRTFHNLVISATSLVVVGVIAYIFFAVCVVLAWLGLCLIDALQGNACTADPPNIIHVFWAGGFILKFIDRYRLRIERRAL